MREVAVLWVRCCSFMGEVAEREKLNLDVRNIFAG
jgi:hypothetical protein